MARAPKSSQRESIFPETGETLPVLFLGHGSPMNALEENAFSRSWQAEGKALPRPKAILCISAHWETAGSLVTAMERPETIHDFGGFPEELFAMQYPAPGSPDLARLAGEIAQSAPVTPDLEWGLDHGTWSVLSRLFPAADVPVVQLGLDYTKPPEFHYRLGRELRPLRRRGILVVGSGNMVHNLRLAAFQEEGFDWAIAFDRTLERLITSGDHETLIRYPALGREARLSIPTNEHYLPMLYALAMREEGEPLRFFAEGVTLGSISMRSFRIG